MLSDLARADGIEDARDILYQAVELLVVLSGWPAREPIATQVRRNHPPTQLRQHRNLVSPGMPAFGEPVQKQGDILALAGLVSDEGQAARRDFPLGNHGHNLISELALNREDAIE